MKQTRHYSETALIKKLNKTARKYADISLSPATNRAYDYDWSVFLTWAKRNKVKPMPCSPVDVANFLAQEAKDRSISTIIRRLSAICVNHRQRGFDFDRNESQLWLVMRGIRRELATMPPRRAKALLRDDMRKIVKRMPNTAKGKRDRALMIIGFLAGLRRSEIVLLDWTQPRRLTSAKGFVKVHNDHIEIIILQSKSDQFGDQRHLLLKRGRYKSTCPVRALIGWRKMSPSQEGPVFKQIGKSGHITSRRLGTRSVSRIIKSAAASIGLDPADYSGHSLRAGHVTAATMAGIAEREIMTITGHKNLATLRKYIREGEMLNSKTIRQIGL